MTIHTDALVSITEAKRDFSRVARMAEENGAVVILEDNTPRYLLMEFNTVEKDQTASDEDVMALSKRLIEQNREAYEVLAR